MDAERLIPPQFRLRTDNPNAPITSQFVGLPNGFCHTIKDSGVLETLSRAHYQTPAEAYFDCAYHRQLFLGDKLHVELRVDRFFQPGMVTLDEYSIRRPGTVRALVPSDSFPRPQAAPPCQLRDCDISNQVLAAIELGIPYSWSAVRHKLGRDRVGDYLVFWPSWVAAYGSAACDLLGSKVDLSSYTADNPFDPIGIHVCVPWLSELFFNGTYTICISSGRRRLTVANGGWYYGGVKKPLTFQASDRRLPVNSVFTAQHWAVSRFRNGRYAAIGITTAAGKTEGSAGEEILTRANQLAWLGREPEALHLVDLTGLKTAESSRCSLQVVSDDITAAGVLPNGTPVCAEIEPATFNRIDLAKKPGDVPIADEAVNCELPPGTRTYFYNIGFNEETRQFVPWEHPLLDKPFTTNPRITYPTVANSRVRSTCAENTVKVSYLILSVPVPDLPNGFHYPTIVRMRLWDYFVYCCPGMRANKGNPALGEIGDGYWAFEGFFGKRGFTLDSEADMLARDLKFWRAIKRDISCFVVFNGHSMGMKQEFKFSGTFLLRSLLENFGDGLLSAPLLQLPGIYSGAVPDLTAVVPEGSIDPAVWDPRLLDPARLEEQAKQLDLFCYNALNTLLGQSGLGQAEQRFLAQQMRRYSNNSR